MALLPWPVLAGNQAILIHNIVNVFDGVLSAGGRFLTFELPYLLCGTAGQFTIVMEVDKPSCQ